MFYAVYGCSSLETVDMLYMHLFKLQYIMESKNLFLVYTCDTDKYTAYVLGFLARSVHCVLNFPTLLGRASLVTLCRTRPSLTSSLASRKTTAARRPRQGYALTSWPAPAYSKGRPPCWLTTWRPS